MAVVAVRKHPAAATEDPIDAAGEPHEERLHAMRQGCVIVCLDQEV